MCYRAYDNCQAHLRLITIAFSLILIYGLQILMTVHLSSQHGVVWAMLLCYKLPTTTAKFWVLWLDTHNMKSPYQCPRTDLNFRLCFLRENWHEKSTIYRNRCLQHTEICGQNPFISTFSPSKLIRRTISKMEWTTIAGSSAAIYNFIDRKSVV